MSKPRDIGQRVSEENQWVRVAALEQLVSDELVVVNVGDARIAVFADGERVFAVDNRCPHMGFPLDRGTVVDGILTCHWHQARFDLASGCTFDLFADDVPSYETRTQEGVVYVSARPRKPRDAEYHGERLRRGVEQNVALVQAKSLLGLLELDAFDRVIEEVGTYATRNLASFGEGLVRLACVANLRPYLSPATTYQALFYAVRQVARETSSAIPRKPRSPLESDDHDLATLTRWLRQWVQTRHLDAAERTLLTAARLPGEGAVAELLMGAAAERLFANTGHLFDFCNKGLELSEYLGDRAIEDVLPLLTIALTAVRGEEESTAWRHPIDIVEPLRALEAELPALLDAASGGQSHDDGGQDDGALVEVLLGDDPLAILTSLRDALAAGAPPVLLAARVAYVAALRLARFATSNEVTDWFSVQHTMNFTCAVHRAVERSSSPDVVRAIFQGAIAVYMDRYLNVPPARLPGERSRDDLPTGAEELRTALLETLDQRADLDTAAALVSRYLRAGHPFEALVDTLTYATVREDLDFHTLQVLEGGVRLCGVWRGGSEVEHIMVGIVRNLAAQCPTRRAGQQTAEIAMRLHRGDAVYED